MVYLKKKRKRKGRKKARSNDLAESFTLKKKKIPNKCFLKKKKKKSESILQRQKFAYACCLKKPAKIQSPATWLN